MNRVLLTGRLTRDPEMRGLASGKNVTTFTVASNEFLGAGKEKEYIEVAEGRLIDPKGAKGRYVRLYSNGNTANDLNHYVEVEVYGTTVK